MWLKSPTGRILVIHKTNLAQKEREGWMAPTKEELMEHLGVVKAPKEAPKTKETPKIKVVELVETPKKRVRRTKAQIAADNAKK